MRAVEQEQRLIRRIEPIYPEAARQARLQELVILQATIDEQGNVSDVRLIRGHPLLAEAAVTAARQWKYRPLILYGNPTQVIATVVVQFPR